MSSDWFEAYCGFRKLAYPFKARPMCLSSLVDGFFARAEADRICWYHFQHRGELVFLLSPVSILPLQLVEMRILMPLSSTQQGNIRLEKINTVVTHSKAVVTGKSGWSTPYNICNIQKSVMTANATSSTPAYLDQTVLMHSFSSNEFYDSHLPHKPR